jgi:hypothetical protein
MFMANICIHYKDRLDGGGSAYAKDYRAYLGNRGMPKQARTFEWCAGPGFIGFSLLGAGLTETLRISILKPSPPAGVQLRTMHWPRALTCTSPIISQTFLSPSNGTLLLAIRRGSRTTALVIH